MYEEASRLSPERAEAYVQLGYSRLAAGDPRGALENFDHAVRLRPGDPVVAIHPAVALWDDGRPEACALFDDALRALERTGRRGSVDWVHALAWRLNCLPAGKREDAILRELPPAAATVSACDEFYLWLTELQVDAALASGAPHRAGPALAAALARCRGAKHPLTVARLSVLEGRVHGALGRREPAAAAAEDAVSRLAEVRPVTPRECGLAAMTGADALDLLDRGGAAEAGRKAYAGVTERLRCSSTRHAIARVYPALMRHALRVGELTAAADYRRKAEEAFSVLRDSAAAAALKADWTRNAPSSPPTTIRAPRDWLNGRGPDPGRAECRSGAVFAAAQAALDAGLYREAGARADAALRAPRGGATPGTCDYERLGWHAQFMRLAGRASDAERDLASLKAADPPTYDSLIEASRLELALGRPAEALPSADAAERLRPDGAEAPAAAAGALEALGRVDEAISRMERAVERRPGAFEIRMRLGRLYRLAGRFEDAKEAYRAARRLAPADADAYVEIGYSRLFEGDSAGAVRSFEDAARLRPEDPAILHHVGIALLRSGKSEEGCARLRAALAMFDRPNSPKNMDWVHTGLAIARFHCAPEGERDASMLPFATRGLGLAPPCSEDWRWMVDFAANALVAAGRAGEAERQVLQARERCPGARDPLRLHLDAVLAEVLEAKGDRAGAVAAAERSLDALGRFRPAELESCYHDLLRGARRVGEALDRMGARPKAAEAYALAGANDRCMSTLQESAQFHEEYAGRLSSWGERAAAAAQRARAAELLRSSGDADGARRLAGGDRAAAAAPGAAAARGGAAPIDGVMLVSIDALRRDRVRATRGGRPLMPALDELAGRCADFENAVSQAPWTLPSMMTAFTSLLPHRHGVTNRFSSFSAQRQELAQLPRSLRTFPEALHDAGVETAAFTGDAGLDGVAGFARGFDVYFDSVPFAGLTTTVPLALDWLRARSPRRFFLFVHGYDTHGQGPAPAAAPDAPVRRERFLELRRRGIEGRPLDLGAGEAESWRRFYDERAAAADRQLERLLVGLRSIPGLAERTAIVVIADHGEALLERGLLDHGQTLYDEELRVPLVVCVPGARPIRVREQVRLLDLAPTILDLLGIDDPRLRAQAQGASVLPAARGGAVGPRDSLSETDFLFRVSKRALRTADGRKLIFDLERLEWELYDLGRDPEERRNLAASREEARAELERRMRRLMDVPSR